MAVLGFALPASAATQEAIDAASRFVALGRRCMAFSVPSRLACFKAIEDESHALRMVVMDEATRTGDSQTAEMAIKMIEAENSILRYRRMLMIESLEAGYRY